MRTPTESLPSASMSARPSEKSPPIPSAVWAEIVQFYREQVPAEVACPPGPSPERPRNVFQDIDLAYEEYCQRWERGEEVDLEDFYRRYPSFQSSLRKLVGVHHEMDVKAQAEFEKADPLWPESGANFLQFHLLHPLGCGSFSRVFLAAERTVGNRLVVVKITTRGVREAKTLGRLNHPNIVRIYSVSQEAASGLTVVCMPYEGNTTLGHVLVQAFDRPGLPDRAEIILAAARQGRHPDDTAPQEEPREFINGKDTYVDGIVSLAVPLAEALAFIHARGVYHRDLKPSNVLLTAQGKPMLLDFNLCQDARLGIQEMGGTIPYMSPEQLRAAAPDAGPNPTTLDARSDLFSLGVILYELLSGRHPFGLVGLNLPEAERFRELLQKQRRGPIPLRSVNPDVPKALARVIQRCLAFDPARRFQQAADVAAALRKHLARAQRPRRRRAFFPAAGLAALAVLVACFFALREPEGQRLFNRGQAALQGGEYQQALESFTSVLKAEPNRVDALFARGRVHQKMGNLALALADFQSASHLAPEGRISACIGYCMGLSGDAPHAIRFYCEAIEQGFAPAEVYNNLGFAFWHKGQWKKALEYLDKAIERNDKLHTAYYNRASVYFNKALQEPQDARKSQFVNQGTQDIDKAIRLGPRTADLYLLAVHVYCLKAKTDAHALQTALDYAHTALDLGLDPKKLQDEAERETSLAILRDHPRFKNLLLSKPYRKNPPAKAPHLLDPIGEGALE
jgi:serine/threonine protein kinase/Tfp pilus assembly protein PilF